MAVIFAKYPRPGAVKTRLIGTVSAENAARIHAICLRHILQAATQTPDLDVILATTPVDADFSPFLLTDIQTIDQGSGDLGQRLARVSELAFATGYRQVHLLGSDCPTLTSDDLLQAMVALARVDVAIGPAYDGGYYLLGSSCYEASLFEEIDWSTEQVAAQTIERIQSAGLAYETLRPQRDLDDASDLRALLESEPTSPDALLRETRDAIAASITESWNDE